VVVLEVADDLGGGSISWQVSKAGVRSYRVVVVFLHVVHDPGLRSGVFACLVRHLDVIGMDDRIM